MMKRSALTPFCLIPRTVLTEVGFIFFVRMRGVLIPEWPKVAPERVIPDSTSLFLSYLKKIPQTYVVLIPDEYFGLDDARHYAHYPLRLRFVGAIDGDSPDLGEACRQWMDKFVGDNPYAILDNRPKRYLDQSHVVFVAKKTGMTKMELNQARAILNLGNDLMLGDARNDAEKLAAAANLELAGQSEVAGFILERIVKKLPVELSKYERETGVNRLCQWHRAAHFLGVRLRVVVEPATE